MPIPLTSVFRKDLDSKLTNIQTLTIIGWNDDDKVADENAVFLSDAKQFFDGNQYLDVNLKVSLIKEKLNLDTRALTVNKLSLTVSNLTNITDILSRLDMINLPVAVFYKSQGCKVLSDCPMIYYGRVVRYTHDDKIAKIQLEDDTGIKLSKVVPIANLGTGEKAYSDDYRNRPIPIAYGYLPKAPAVIWPETSQQSTDLYGNDSENISSGFHVIADDVFNSVNTRFVSGNLQNQEGNLLIEKGDGSYWNVYSNPDIDFDDRLGDGESDNNFSEYEDGVANENFESGNYQGLELSVQTENYNNISYFCPRHFTENLVPKNPISKNICLASHEIRPTQVLTGDAVVTEDDEAFTEPVFTEFLGPSRGLYISNPQALRDSLDTQESIALGLNPNETYSRFPDNDIDTLVDMAPPPFEDFSGDLSNFLDSTENGNFLRFFPQEIGDVRQGNFTNTDVHHANILSSGYRVQWPWPIETIEDEDGNILNREIPSQVPFSPSTLENNDAGISGPKQLHQFQWVDDTGGEKTYHFDWNFTGYDFGHGAGSDPIYQMWNEDLSRYNQGAINGMTDNVNAWRQFPYIHSLLFAYQADFKSALVQIPDNYTLLSKFMSWTRTKDEFSVDLGGTNFSIFEWQYYSEIALPGNEEIINEANADTGITFDSDAYYNFTCDNEIPFLFMMSEITSKSMAYFPVNNQVSRAHIKSAFWEWDEETERARWNVPDHSDPSDKWFPENPLFPMVLDAENYGDQVWYFPWKWDWKLVEDICTNPDGSIPSNPNGKKLPVPNSWVAFNFTGDLNINKMAPTGPDTSEEYANNITHVFSLCDFYNFADYAVLPAVQRHESTITDKTINDNMTCSHNYMWNGVTMDTNNQTNESLTGSKTTYGVGSASDFNAEEIDTDINTLWPYNPHHEGAGLKATDTALYEGGVGRFHFLQTQDNGLGQKAGCLTPARAVSYSAFWGYPDEWESPAYMNYGGISHGKFANYQSEDWAVLAKGVEGSEENQFNHSVIGLKLFFPAIGQQDGISGSFKTQFKYKFNIQTDLDTLAEQANLQTNIMNFMHLIVNAHTTTPAFDGNWNRGGYSRIRDLELSFQEILDLSDENGNIMINNVDPDDYPNALNFGTYGSGEILEGIEGDIFTSGQYPRNKGNNWDEGPNQFKSVNLRLEVRPKDIVFPVSTVMPVNLQLYDLGLNIDGVFDNFDSSNFYIKDYLGRSFGDIGILRKDTDILNHFVKEELGYKGKVNISNDTGAYSLNLGFSVVDEITGRELITSICSNTRVIPAVKGVDELVFNYIKDSYDTSNKTIREKDVVDIKFSLSKIENVKSMVEVKFAKDYATDNYTLSTGFLSAKDLYGDGDLGYEGGYSLSKYHLGEEYNLAGTTLLSEELTSNIFHADYITEVQDAIKLQEFLVMFNCNQHLIVDVKLPITYIDLQVGDIIDFDKLISNKKAYGLDYTKSEEFNGQTLQPFFMVTETKKKTKEVSFKAVRLPVLERKFYAGLGDIARRGKSVNMDNLPVSPAQMPDSLDESMIYDYVIDKTKKYTREQIQNMDINQSNGITFKDATLLAEITEMRNDLLGGPVVET